MGENSKAEMGANPKPVEALTKKEYVTALRAARDEALAQETKLINEGFGPDKKGELSAYAASLAKIGELVKGLQAKPEKDSLRIILDVYKGRVATQDMAKNILNDFASKGQVGEALKKTLSGQGNPNDRTLAQKPFNQAYSFYKTAAESLTADNSRKPLLQKKAENALVVCQTIQNDKFL